MSFSVNQHEDGHLSITCHLCGRTSHHPQDVDNKYCSFCHVFHVEETQGPIACANAFNQGARLAPGIVRWPPSWSISIIRLSRNYTDQGWAARVAEAWRKDHCNVRSGAYNRRLEARAWVQLGQTP